MYYNELNLLNRMRRVDEEFGTGREFTTDLSNTISSTFTDRKYELIPDKDIGGYDIGNGSNRLLGCLNKNNFTGQFNNIQAGSNQEYIKMVENSRNLCSTLPNCRSFNVHYGSGNITTCLKSVGTDVISPNDFNYDRNKSISKLALFNRKCGEIRWPNQFPSTVEKQIMECFEDTKEPESVWSKITSLPDMLFGKKEEIKEGFDRIETVQESYPLYLTIFADDEAQVYTYDTVNKKLSDPIVIAFFNQTQKRRIPNFTNNHILIFRVKNGGGPGYFIAQWEWNNRLFYSDRTTLTIPDMSYINPSRLNTVGQFMGCYRDDSTTGSKPLSRNLGNVRSVEDCASVASRLQNTQDVFYGIRTINNIPYCFSNDKLYGCNNTSVSGLKVNCNNINFNRPFVGNRARGINQPAGVESQGTTSIYNLKTGGNFVKSVVETYNPLQTNTFLSNIRNRNEINTNNAKLIKVQLSATSNIENNYGFGGDLWNTGYTEFVWTPSQKNITIAMKKVCSNRKYNNFEASNFYDVTAPKETLRNPDYTEVDDKTCSAAFVDETNILSQSNKERVVETILSVVSDYLNSAKRFREYTYLDSGVDNLKVKVRIDDDARFACIAAKGNCKSFETRDQAMSDTSTEEIQCNPNQYTPGSWCVNALNAMYELGDDSLRYSRTFTRALFDFITIARSSKDIRAIVELQENNINLDEESYISFNKFENMSSNDIDILKSRLRSIFDLIYTFNPEAISRTTTATDNITTINTTVDIVANDVNKGSILKSISKLYDLAIRHTT
jgi:hypothetical protein